MDYKTALAEYGYYINQDNQMRSVGSDEPFSFVAKPEDQDYNQARYEAIGEIVDQMVFQLLESECKLQRRSVPVKPTSGQSQTFVFMSENFMEADKLLVLVHGSGVVRAGQWARRLIINDSLDTGTQIPYIKKAQEQGYAILVMNTNDNSRNQKRIQGSEDPLSHFKYVWQNYVMKTGPATKIAIVAHSYGGHCTMLACSCFAEDFRKRVFAIALTDSVHSQVDRKRLEFVSKISRNWVSSSQPLDTPIERSHDIPCVSAGTGKHEMTSATSIDSIFEFFTQKLAAWQLK